MKIGVTGANGQLGTSLLETLSRNHEVIPFRRPEFDLLSRPGDSVRSAGLDVLIHAAAMTNVDGCAEDPELAMRSNGEATGEIARACAEERIRMFYISSNEVFSGKEEKIWFEYDAVGPVNEYGKSKLAGEELAGASGAEVSIVRVSWVFGSGFENFPSKMCALADRLNTLKVVADEVACPSYAPDVAEAVAGLIDQPSNGVFHLCNEGPVSRFDFAKRILEVTGRDIPMEPIPQSAFPRPSQPPLYTPLGNKAALALGVRMRSWMEAVEDWAALERRAA